jgi:phosphate transport system substrate-binding protein
MAITLAGGWSVTGRPASPPAPDPASSEMPGRPLLLPDPVCPELDSALRPYVPCGRLSRGTRVGSTPAILPDLSRNWATAFEAMHGGVSLDLPPPYEGPQGRLSATLRRFLDGEYQFAFLTREMTASDKARYQLTHGGDPIVVPVARGSYRHFGFVDPVVVIVHATNPVAGLTYAQLDAVYSTTRLRGAPEKRVWGDLGVKQHPWNDLPIRALGGGRAGQDDSAKAATLRRRVLAHGSVDGQWRSGMDSAGPDGTAVPARVAADRTAIGITSLAHLVPGNKTLAIARDDAGPWVPPTKDHIFDGSYPLTRTIDLVFGPATTGTVDRVLLEFARFLLSREAQEIVLAQGIFLPLDRETYRQSLARVERWAPCRR